MPLEMTLKVDTSGFGNSSAGSHLIAKTSGAKSRAVPPKDALHRKLKELSESKAIAPWMIVEISTHNDILSLIVRSTYRSKLGTVTGSGTNYSVLEITGNAQDFLQRENKISLSHLLDQRGLWDHFLAQFFEEKGPIILDDLLAAETDMTPKPPQSDFEIYKDDVENAIFVSPENLPSFINYQIKSRPTSVYIISGDLANAPNIWVNNWKRVKKSKLEFKKNVSTRDSLANTTKEGVENLNELAKIIEANISLITELKKMKRSRRLRFHSTQEIDTEIENVENVLLRLSVLQKKLLP
jgi:hypothetical protein